MKKIGVRFCSIIILALCFTALTSFNIQQDDGYEVNKTEAKKAFEYLNLVRQNPSAYSKEIGVNLNNEAPRVPLVWNAILEKVAEEKAIDMVKRDYFEHVDPDGNGINILIHKAGYTLPEEWISNKSDNYFESICSGIDTGVEAIKFLIVDEGINPPGHRIHLLGIGEFVSNLEDIGIGIAKSTEDERVYMSVIIAKHNW